MNGPAHYRAAERLAGMAHDWTYGDRNDPVVGAALAAEAQVHATLALAAATALTGHGAGYLDDPEIRAWREAAGTRAADGKCVCDHHGDHAGCDHDCECAL